MGAAERHPRRAGQLLKILGVDGRWYAEDIALQRYLLTDGGLGALPDWYPLIRAAKYLGVAPWDLLQQPLFWQQKALLAEKVESAVQDQLQQQAEAAASIQQR